MVITTRSYEGLVLVVGGNILKISENYRTKLSFRDSFSPKLE